MEKMEQDVWKGSVDQQSGRGTQATVKKMHRSDVIEMRFKQRCREDAVKSDACISERSIPGRENSYARTQSEECASIVSGWKKASGMGPGGISKTQK